MAPKKKTLFELTAGDLMSHEVVTIPAELPLADAAHLLQEANIHGAPVVDKHGRCVGVLSVSDLARWAVNKSAPRRGATAGLRLPGAAARARWTRNRPLHSAAKRLPVPTAAT